MIGGVLVGAGMLWISTTTNYLSWVLGFGVLAAGILLIAGVLMTFAIKPKPATTSQASAIPEAIYKD